MCRQFSWRGESKKLSEETDYMQQEKGSQGKHVLFMKLVTDVGSEGMLSWDSRNYVRIPRIIHPRGKIKEHLFPGSLISLVKEPWWLQACLGLWLHHSSLYLHMSFCVIAPSCFLLPLMPLWASAAWCPRFQLCLQGSGGRGTSGQNVRAVAGECDRAGACETEGLISWPRERYYQTGIGGPALRLWGNFPQTLCSFDLQLVIWPHSSVEESIRMNMKVFYEF